VLLVSGLPLFAGLLIQAGLSERTAFIAAACWWPLVLLAAVALSNLLRYYRPPRGSEWQFLFWNLALSLLPMLSAAPARALTKDPALDVLIDNTVALRWFLAILLPGTAGLFAWVRKSGMRNLEQQQYLREAERLHREAALQALRNQMQPHFLFNSLNSIHALIATRPEDARRMTENLSDFLRQSLRHEPHTLVPLQQEIALLQRYLEVESWRFGHRLKVEWEVPDDCLSFPVPVLVLQLLLENAVKFGLYGNDGKVLIAINCQLQDNKLRFHIENPLPADPVAKSKGTGFGLSGLKRRLQLLYGAGRWLDTHTGDTTFTVSLIIPRSG